MILIIPFQESAFNALGSQSYLVEIKLTFGQKNQNLFNPDALQIAGVQDGKKKRS